MARTAPVPSCLSSTATRHCLLRPSMSDVLNISAYTFTPLQALPALREALLRRGTTLGLKGTVLLSPEGINLFIAGAAAAVQDFLGEIRRLPGLEKLPTKESRSERAPFGRFRVKIKPEIITFGVEGIDPARRPARALAPETLKAWLDAGRAVTLLDTRNDYEVRLGTFHGAIELGIRRFRDFPAAVARLPESSKTEPIVTFCTGGIRCEKAAPFLEQQGFADVYQLDGGILTYFERCGGAHFAGTCFVFDERVGVDDTLGATHVQLCPRCQRPLPTATAGLGPATACPCTVHPG